MKNIKKYFDFRNCYRFVPFLVLFFALFIQSVLYKYLQYHIFIFSNLWNNLPGFYYSYISHLTSSFFIASMIFLFRNRYWRVILIVLVTLWLFSNLVYMRSYNSLISYYDFVNVGQLFGIMDSVVPFIRITDLSLLVVPVLYFIYLPFEKIEKPFSALYYIVFFIFSIFLSCTMISKWRDFKDDGRHVKLNPFSSLWYDSYQTYFNRDNMYERVYSPYFYIGLQVKASFFGLFEDNTPSLDEKEVEKFVGKNRKIDTDKNVIFVIFESLEGWNVNRELAGQEITPNINRLIHSEHCIYSTTTKAQNVNGMSSDIQLSANTGLLPITTGSTCNRFNTNLFYSIPGAMPKNYTKYTYSPTELWNQYKITKSYGYDSTVMVKGDREMFDMFEKDFEHFKSNSYSQLITIASHTPFDAFADSSSLKVPNYYPEILSKYIRSVNYTDMLLGRLVDKMFNDEKYSNSIFVLVGDHTFFGPESIEDFSKAIKGDLPVKERYVGMAIYSKLINKSIEIDSCYQMDIYPTLLYLLQNDSVANVQEYKEQFIWKGMGVNLLDSVALKNRNRADVPKLNILSDKIIRNNYLKKLKELESKQ